MAISRSTWRWVMLTGLWTLVGLILWLMAVQAFLVLVTPFGTWQRPGIARVTVKWVERDPESAFTDHVVVAEGEGVRTLSMLKAERAELAAGETIWILDNYYVTATRPAQFRLTLLRLLLEYPEPLLILALVAVGRLRRAQVREKAVEQDPARPRTVIRDDFHQRALRFAPPKDRPEKD